MDPVPDTQAEMSIAMCHELLKVSPDANVGEIDAAYRREVSLLCPAGESLPPEKFKPLIDLLVARFAIFLRDQVDTWALQSQIERMRMQVEHCESLRPHLEKALMIAEHAEENARLLRRIERNTNEDTARLQQYLTEVSAREDDYKSKIDILQREISLFAAKLQESEKECHRQGRRATMLEVALNEKRKTGGASMAELQLAMEKLQGFTTEATALREELAVLRKKEVDSRVEAQLSSAQAQQLAAEVIKLRAELVDCKRKLGQTTQNP
jgi:chromosome segregation ATPase